jgi:peptidyl-prolyl cis-trans isomerase C
MVSAAHAKDKVVATVNGETIKLSVLERTYQQNLLLVTNKPVTKQKVLNDLINRKLGIQRARKEKLQKEDIVKRKMEDILYHAMVSKDLEPKLKKIVVTDNDVNAYYKKHPEYRTATILFRLPIKPKDNQWQDAQKKAMKLYGELKLDPSKFAEYANKYSESASSPNGGDLGFQPAIRLAPEYFTAINGKSNGFITPPVRTQFGYHIIKILARKDVKNIDQALYKKIVYDIKRDKILAQYFTDLKSGAKIKVNDSLL